MLALAYAFLMTYHILKFVHYKEKKMAKIVVTGDTLTKLVDIIINLELQTMMI